MSWKRPTSNDASCSNAEGEKSSAKVSQPTQRSVAATVTELPLSVAERQHPEKLYKSQRDLQVALIFLPQRGLLLGLTPS